MTKPVAAEAPVDPVDAVIAQWSAFVSEIEESATEAKLLIEAVRTDKMLGDAAVKTDEIKERASKAREDLLEFQRSRQPPPKTPEAS